MIRAKMCFCLMTEYKKFKNGPDCNFAKLHYVYCFFFIEFCCGRNYFILAITLSVGQGQPQQNNYEWLVVKHAAALTLRLHRLFYIHAITLHRKQKMLCSSTVQQNMLWLTGQMPCLFFFLLLKENILFCINPVLFSYTFCVGLHQRACCISSLSFL